MNENSSETLPLTFDSRSVIKPATLAEDGTGPAAVEALERCCNQLSTIKGTVHQKVSSGCRT